MTNPIPLEGDTRRSSDRRSSLIAFGGWAAFSIVLLAGTMTALGQAEVTERIAVLDRADAGAAALEQTMMRVFEQIAVLQNLAETRARMIAEGDASGRRAIEAELRDLSPPTRFGIMRISLVGPDGKSAWIVPTPVGSAPAQLEEKPDTGVRATTLDERMTISGPQIDTDTSRRLVTVRRALLERDGRLSGYVVTTVDPLMLSNLIASRDSSLGEQRVVQRRDDGTIIARSHDPALALSEHVSNRDPVLTASAAVAAGRFRDWNGSVDRLVGFRALRSVPIVVSDAIDTQVALKDFLELRRVVLALTMALIVAALIATRLAHSFHRRHYVAGTMTPVQPIL